MQRRLVWRGTAAAAILAAAAFSTAWAGVHNLFNNNNNVGGISINAEGVVGNPDPQGRQKLLDILKAQVKKAPGEMNGPVELRKISLKGLEKAIAEHVKENFGRLPDEIQYLAGIQRIEYVFVYPEEGDIVLAGPGEGWKVDEQANVVGITTGKPVIQLDHLVTALRSVHDARTEGISVSINPTPEGTTALQRVLADQRKLQSVNRPALEAKMKEAFGPQIVTLTGVPEDSGFARILVAADYRMKKLGMNLEESPIPGFESYVDMMKASRSNRGGSPRWWMACDYQPLQQSEDGLAWHLRGRGVKAMTESEHFQDGEFKATGQEDPVAQRWADNFTEKYDELSQEIGVFGQLRNLMDLCVIAALLEKEDLYNKAGLELATLRKPDGAVPMRQWFPAKTIEPQCSFLRTRSGWIVTASGGVQIESWQVVQKSEPAAKVGEIRKSAAGKEGSAWWWN